MEPAEEHDARSLVLRGGKTVSIENIDMEELTRFAMDLVQRAGKEALKYYGRGNPEVKFDEALVTEAELHLEGFFQQELAAQYPEHEIFGASPARKDYTHGEKGYLWVYDALDGVANFQAGIPIWGTSLALLENFWPIFGVFFMPSSGDLLHARAGEKAYWNQNQIRIPESGEISNESVLLTYSRFHQHHRPAHFPGKIRNLGCTGAHLSYVASGRAEAALLANISYRDLAASQIILKAAGGEIRKLDGSKFYLNEYMEGQRIEDYLLAVPEGGYSSVAVYLETESSVNEEEK